MNSYCLCKDINFNSESAFKNKCIKQVSMFISKSKNIEKYQVT